MNCKLTEKTTVQELQTNVDSNEQFERRDTPMVPGPSIPKASHNENCKQIVQNLIQQPLPLRMSPANESIAHRLGYRPTASPDKRNMIFKLCRR